MCLNPLAPTTCGFGCLRLAPLGPPWTVRFLRLFGRGPHPKGGPALCLPCASESPPPVSESKNKLVRESYGHFRARKAIWVRPYRAPPIRPPTRLLEAPAPASQVRTPRPPCVAWPLSCSSSLTSTLQETRPRWGRRWGLGSRHARKTQARGAPTPSGPPRAGRAQGDPLMYIRDAWQSARSMRAGLR